MLKASGSTWRSLAAAAAGVSAAAPVRRASSLQRISSAIAGNGTSEGVSAAPASPSLPCPFLLVHCGAAWRAKTLSHRPRRQAQAWAQKDHAQTCMFAAVEEHVRCCLCQGDMTERRTAQGRRLRCLYAPCLLARLRTHTCHHTETGGMCACPPHILTPAGCLTQYRKVAVVCTWQRTKTLPQHHQAAAQGSQLALRPTALRCFPAALQRILSAARLWRKDTQECSDKE